ncbi:hypothetical protein BDM02DRAFT_3104572 [Thelephora ganbajun]|uniref:Uncharacterized protein n=1 Tax=Thelephora ganbajun TaxID=370292 RepID=A0ACB6Z0V6_THEGA|nr:hypothetical protein BDM02DRAFT_3104572 [Thelephora ganbajun]
MGQAVSRKSRVPDGIIFKQTASCNIPLVLLEYKRAIGEGGCDPFLQAAYSLREFLFKDELSGLLDKCGCPSFLLAGGGTRLSILGVIHTDKFIVQQLADVYIGEATTHEDTRAFHVAKVFTSLRDARATLDKYYEGILRQETSSTSPQQGPPTPRRCFFPYPTKFREYGVGTGAEAQVTEFEYTDVPDADPANVTFFVRVKSSGRKLVVKFVDRYGVEAHEHMAKVGMAPRLLYCGSLDGENDVRHGKSCVQGEVKHGLYVGPLRMAVMEYIKPEERPGDAREKTREVIDELHGRGFVFGDLREPNVLFSGGKVYLIDFDWAGKIGEARYPRGLSSRVDWPGEAESLERELIEADHDFIMLSRLFPE